MSVLRVLAVQASALRQGTWVRQVAGAAEASLRQADRARLVPPVAVGQLAGEESELQAAVLASR
ncbi:hypothetical protein MAE02_60660 [Microvirga aerophila]|uniref:Uncharacterized protein n=1 Tax=Microvirga aerophila TaxID=670291 RepID=A0A512C2D6_9HYPH|nr:hypothetical protein MAE02_60660 [Microvirga aerophila]